MALSRRYLSSTLGQDYRRRAFAAVAEARRTGLPLREVAPKHDISVITVKRHLPGAVYRSKRDRQLHVRRSDRYRRPVMRVLTRDGERMLIPVSSREASIIGRHHSAIGRWAKSTDNRLILDAKSDLQGLENTEVAGVDAATGKRVSYILETDLGVIYDLAERGLLPDDDPYEEIRAA